MRLDRRGPLGRLGRRARDSIATRQRAASNLKSHQLLSAEEADSDDPTVTSGMLGTGGRGRRPRVGPPHGHPGSEAGRQDRTKRSTWPQSWSVARRSPHGVTGTARFCRAEGSLRKPGRPGCRTQSSARTWPRCARGTETLRDCPAGLGYGLASTCSPRPGPLARTRVHASRPADRLGRDQSTAYTATQTGRRLRTDSTPVSHATGRLSL